jgi:2-polyprenyl-6-methoxyphenol hydroxylase-like FAD-dependent oxidoreductase
VIGQVIVAGGGIAGLALGIALRHRGVEVTVLERTTAPGRAGGGLVLAPNGVKALEACAPGLAAVVRAAGHPTGERSTTGHRSAFLTTRGRVLGSVSFDGYEERWGQPAIAIPRAELHTALARAAASRGVDIVTGFTADHHVDHGSFVELSGTSGEAVRGDVLVGADGLRSAVRAGLLEDGEPHYRGLAAVGGIGPAPGEHPEGFIAYGRGTVLFTAALGNGQAYWLASMAAAAGVWPRCRPAAAWAAVMDRLQEWDPDLRRTVAETDPGSCLTVDVFDRPPPPTVHRGRVTLVGDAAHPMVYTLGQGAGMALEDAAVLGIRLAEGGRSGVKSALDRYSADRAARVRKVVRQSRLLGRIGHVRSPLAASIRDFALGVLTRGDGDRQNAALFGWLPPRATD